MMHKLWQKNLELNYSSNIVDIVQYGSSVIEGTNPKDIDIAVFYKNNISLEEQLNESQHIKQQLKQQSDLKIDIKSFTSESLFDSSNFAKEDILIYGISLIDKTEFCNKLGFTSKILIKYNLSNLEKKDKVRLNYFLSGKGKIEGYRLKVWNLRKRRCT